MTIQSQSSHHCTLSLSHTYVHSLYRHVHCIEGTLQNKVRIQLVHLLKELFHPTLSLVRHHKKLYTLESAKTYSKMKIQSQCKITQMGHHTTYIPPNATPSCNVNTQEHINTIHMYCLTNESTHLYYTHWHTY